jgi:hypothetical protein
MMSTQERDDAVKNIINANKIASISELKTAVGSESTMTVFRSLSRLGYLTSYSHRGRFYTLTGIPEFDESGLWSYRSVRFSLHGNLLETAAALVLGSDRGFSASELESVLQVEATHALLELFQRKQLSRSKLGGHFVYMSADAGVRRRQELMRSERQAGQEVGWGLDSALISDELKAGIILFFSILDEKQRRLYAGLEAAKLGHGGDRKIAELLGLDPHTVSKGRLEMFSDSVNRKGIRHSGGGRKRIEKKHLK